MPTKCRSWGQRHLHGVHMHPNIAHVLRLLFHVRAMMQNPCKCWILLTNKSLILFFPSIPLPNIMWFFSPNLCLLLLFAFRYTQFPKLDGRCMVLWISLVGFQSSLIRTLMPFTCSCQLSFRQVFSPFLFIASFIYFLFPIAFFLHFIKVIGLPLNIYLLVTAVWSFWHVVWRACKVCI